MIIKVDNLSKTFRSRGNKNLFSGVFRPDWRYFKAVDKISFEIKKGESVAFLGPNGAGKTTTTKMLTGLLYPTSGNVEVLGYTPFERNHDYLRRIGLVMGNKAGLNWDLTANQSFELLQTIYQIEPNDFAESKQYLSQILGVSGKLDSQVRRLSLGERMKVELIGAILHKPDILFLDEPTIGLDIESKKAVRKFLRRIQQEKEITVLMTSHDMDDIEQVSDRVLVINHGQIAYDDSMKSLLARYSKHKYIKLHFKDDVNPTELKQYGQLVDSEDGVLLKVPSKDLSKVLSDLTGRYKLDDINIESTPLETIITDIFKGD